MYEDDEKIYEEQNKKLAQFFIDDHDYLIGMLDCMIEVAEGEKKEKLMKTRAELDKSIKDLYPIVEGSNKKGR